MTKMPAKYPVGIQTFSSLIEEGYLYIDKTDLIYDLVNGYKCVFLSRPRRFGKSLLTSTLESYFSGNKKLFLNLKIHRLEKNWDVFPVFHFDLSAENFDHPQRLINYISNDLKSFESRMKLPSEGSISQRLKNLIIQAYNTTGKKVVILIDEYDKPMLDSLDKTEIYNDIREELRGFYSVIKACDRYIRFAFLTGITKFSRVSVFSGLNNLKDISLHPAFNAICGISETEMHEYFRESVECFASNEGISAKQVWEKLKYCYDGYHFARRGEDIYNPISVLNTFDECEFRDYWFETGNPKFLFSLIRDNHFEIANFEGATRTADQLSDISNLSSDIVPLLYQAGYLTIKDYDADTSLYILGFPNREVSRQFWQRLASYFFKTYSNNGVFGLQQFVRDINEGKPESFMTRLQSLFADTSSETEMAKEIHFQNMMAIVTKMMGYTVMTERHSSQGRCDMILQTDKYIYLFEFKVNDTSEHALNQIFEKGYYKPFVSDSRIKFLIGANFSTKTRTLESWLIKKLP